jgi:epoxyqueuosine reductase
VSTYKYEPPTTWADTVADRWRQLQRDVGVGGFSIAVLLATHTVFPIIRWMQQRRIDRGETIWLDDMPGPSPKQTFETLPQVPADLTPNPGIVCKKARQMKVEYPPTVYPFAYREPPISGNTVNGLGELTPRRASHLFFGDSYQRAWGKLDWYFQVMEPTAIHRIIVRMFWQDRQRVGPVAPQAIAPSDPAVATVAIKALAQQCGAALVGITQLTEELCYHDFNPSFTYAISIAVPMDRTEMLHTPSDRSNHEIMSTYLDVNRVAIKVAEHIRALGFPAQASTNIAPDSSVEVLHIPIAIQAGLGQLGKHGSLITPEYGSNVRLATVLTDLPLSIDEPRDIRVDDFCSTCRICETNCPPHAIFPQKQMVRGMERWYVNFDKCVPYFAQTAGCGICIEVCPWSEPGHGLLMVKKLAERQTEK